jgi:DNA-binding MarR family transcriptional regulator
MTENGSMTVARIAKALGLARQSVQRIADLLVKEGLAAYEENPDDLRAQLLCLTPRGRTVLAAIQKAQRSWADSLGAEIGEADLKRALGVIERVSAALVRRRAEAD